MMNSTIYMRRPADCTRELRSPRRFQRFRIVAIPLFLVLMGAGPTAQACQGQDFQRSVQIIDYAWRAGVQIGYEMAWTGDYQLAMQRLVDMSQQLNGAAQQLPYTCQVLINQWANAIGGAFQNPQGTQCMGGVCCDGTGCYGG